MRSKYNNFHEWDDKPTPIDTRFMKGEGFQVSTPAELADKHAYDLDRWAEAWLKKHGHPVREDVGAFKRDDDTRLCIMSVDWKHDALDEFDRQHHRVA
jgi:hypothetical protein